MYSCLESLLKQFNINNKIINDDSIYVNNSNSINTNYNLKKNLVQEKEDKYVIINDTIYNECNICFEIVPLKDIKVLYPCGHRLYCDKCLENYNICFSCREKIIDKIKVFEDIE